MKELTKASLAASYEPRVDKEQQAVENFERESGRDLQGELGSSLFKSALLDDLEDLSPYYLLDDLDNFELAIDLTESESDQEFYPEH